LLRAGAEDVAVEVARYFKYYGQTAFAMHIGFITEVCAYDLGTLCELAFERQASCHDALLATLLEVDRDPESEAEEQSLRGVRKAQVKLATVYLVRGAEPQARRVFEDMKDERPERLRSIRDELAAVESKEFWEIVDRGTNFDYLDGARRDKLREFFAWFPRLAQAELRA
jgi:hypothetical protein